MRTSRLLSPRVTLSVAFAAFALAAAAVVQESGPNQAAHHALVRALASGTAEIDPRETIDASYVDGRYYAAKAPGLAMFTLPWHWTLRAVGLQHQSLTTESGYRNRVWELNLWGAVLPILVLLVLMVIAAERVARGYALPAAVLLACGTLLLPFSTLFFDHVLSATLGFAAFVVLLLARERTRGGWWLAAAGVLAGFAIVVEFPLGVVALVLGAYAAAGVRPARRAASYAAGLVMGVLPLFAYNAWAFGSPWTLGYTNALKAPAGAGAPVVGANDEGFYGVGLPDPRAALSLLVSEKGLLVVTPLVVAAAVGLPLQWRSGRRMETGVCAAIPALFLLYNAAYYLPFGGQGPGPRFLLPALPFLALPLAVALRARPLVVAGVGLVSVAVMLLATVTEPLTGVEYGIATWLDGLGSSALVETLLGRAGVASPWPGVVLVAMLVVAACALSLLRLPLRAAVRRDGLFLVGVLCAWLLLARASPGARSGGRRARDVRGRRGRRRPRSRTLGRLDPRVASQPGCAPPSDSRAGPRDPRTDDAPAVVAARLDARPRRRLGRLAEGAARARPFRRADTPRVGDTGETPRVAAVKALSVVSTSPPPPTHLIAAAIPGRGGRWMADLRDSLVAHAHCRADTVATEAKAATQRRVAQLIALRADGTTAMPRPQHAQDSRRLPDVRGHVWPAHDRAPMRAGILTRGHAGAPCAWQSAPRGRADPDSRPDHLRTARDFLRVEQAPASVSAAPN